MLLTGLVSVSCQPSIHPTLPTAPTLPKTKGKHRMPSIAAQFTVPRMWHSAWGYLIAWTDTAVLAEITHKYPAWQWPFRGSSSNSLTVLTSLVHSSWVYVRGSHLWGFSLRLLQIGLQCARVLGTLQQSHQKKTLRASVPSMWWL